MPEVRIAFDANNHLGEAPIWSVPEQALWWVNCEHPPELHRWRPESGEHRAWPMPQRIGGFALKAGGTLLVALADGLYDSSQRVGDSCCGRPPPSPATLVSMNAIAIGRDASGSVVSTTGFLGIARLQAPRSACSMQGG